MKPSVTIDSSVFKLRLAQLAQAMGVESKELIVGEGRMVALDLMRMTAPYGLNSKAKDMGRGAIVKDLMGGRNKGNGLKSRGIFFVLGSGALKEEERTNGTVMMFAKGNGEVYGTEKRLYRPNATVEEMAAHHQKYRSNSTGRTSMAGSWDRRIGRWIFVNRMVVSGAAMQRYIAHVVEKVGWIKSGWMTAFRALGGDPRKGKIPAWISKHRNIHGGADLSQINAKNPVVTVSNSTKGVARQVGMRVLSAIRRAERRMETKLVKILSGHAFDMRNGVVRVHKPKDTG